MKSDLCVNEPKQWCEVISSTCHFCEHKKIMRGKGLRWIKAGIFKFDWVKFSTLSSAVLLNNKMSACHTNTATYKVEHSAQVSNRKLKFAHGES